MDRTIYLRKGSPFQSSSAQLSLEYVIVFFLLLFLLIMLFRVGTGYFFDLVREKETTQAKALLQWLQQELITASLMETGYHRTITLPPRLLGEPYALKKTNTTLWLLYNNQSYPASIPPFQGNLTANMTYLLQKINETIVVSKKP